MEPRYDAHSDRGEVAARLGGRARPSASPNPEPGADRVAARATSLEMLAVPVRARCTWGTSSSTRSATSSRASGAGTACTCCTRWASTRSACRPRTRRSARAAIRARSSSGTSRTSRETMKRMGWAFDWDRVISAHEPDVLPLDQWLFLKLFEAGLAYRKGAPVKWCPVDQVVLANEQVHDGRCEYCGAEVDLEEPRAVVLQDDRVRATSCSTTSTTIDWPDRIKAMQRNWIGRSEGAEILFRDRGARRRRRPCSRRGPTRCSARRSSCSRRSIRSSSSWPSARRTPTSCASTCARAGVKRGEERAAAEEKTGVFTGFFATNPVNERADPDLGRRLRADGLRHRRDHGRARARRARRRVRRDASTCRSSPVIDEDGDARRTRRSSPALPAEEAKRAIVDWLGERGRGKPAISYRLRDWGFSRQRYWGCPIPIVYCDDHGAGPVPGDELPVLLPDIEDYKPKGIAPLASRRGLGARAVPDVRQGGAARGRDDGHLRRLVVVLPALLRPAQRRRAVATASSSTGGARSTSTSAASTTRRCT